MKKRIARILNSLPSTQNYLLDKTIDRLRQNINEQLSRKVMDRQYNLKVTSASSMTVNRAVGFIKTVLKEDLTIAYWLIFNIKITLAAAAANLTASIEGISFQGDTAIAYTDGDSADSLERGVAVGDTGNVYGESSNTTTVKLFSGAVELKQKPTWVQ